MVLSNHVDFPLPAQPYLPGLNSIGLFLLRTVRSTLQLVRLDEFSPFS